MWKRMIIVFAACLLFVVGCQKEEAVKQVEREEKQNQVIVEEETEVEEEIIETDEYPYHFPFTGIGSEVEVQGRAVAVMINNHPQARPQSGLSEADLIFEILAEGSVTRFLAIFQSEAPDMVGPVRSARDYYIELARGYDSFFVAHGYSPDAEQMLKHGFIDHINGMQYDGVLFKRASDRRAPHNSYISFDNILKGAETNGYDMSQAPSSFVFLADEEIERLTGEQAMTIDISYSDSRFNSTLEYDEESMRYKRYSAGKLTIDDHSGESVFIDNLLVIETPHRIIDDIGRREIDLTSGGRGYLFQKGKITAVEWKNVRGEILPFIDGKQVGLVPGKTWVNVIPKNPGLDRAVTYE